MRQEILGWVDWAVLAFFVYFVAVVLYAAISGKYD